MTAKIYAFPCSKRALDVADVVATEAKAAITQEALTRWRMVQEAIDEFINSGQQFHIGDVVARVKEWERILQNGKA